MKKKIIFYSIISLLVVVFIFLKSNENREKNLGELFHDIDGLNYLEFDLHDGSYDDAWRTDKIQALEELKEFMSLYQVKKMTDEEWNSIQPKGISFQMFISSKNNLIVSSFYEERLFVGDSAYKVINGPIDMEWVRNFDERYKN